MYHKQEQISFDKLSISGFQDFVTSLNIIGLAVGALLGGAINSISEAVGTGVFKPLIELGLGMKDMTFAPPRFDFMSIFQKALSFAVTAGVLYAIITIFDIKVRKPVTHVKIVSSEEPGREF